MEGPDHNVIDGIKRKTELFFNMTVDVLPDATVEFYDYGAAYWLPTGRYVMNFALKMMNFALKMMNCFVNSTDGCWNFPPACSVYNFAFQMNFFTLNDEFCIIINDDFRKVQAPKSCPDGMCTSLGFAMTESFLLDPRVH